MAGKLLFAVPDKKLLQTVLWNGLQQFLVGQNYNLFVF